MTFLEKFKCRWWVATVTSSLFDSERIRWQAHFRGTYWWAHFLTKMHAIKWELKIPCDEIGIYSYLRESTPDEKPDAHGRRGYYERIKRV